jgi:hypothetical protein
MVVQKARFISISANEVTTMDYQSWLSVHVYLITDWKHNPILLTLEEFVNGGIVNNLTKVIVDSVLQYGGLSKFDLASKLINFGANGVSIFQGAKSGVITQLRKKFALYMLGVHCVVHWTNLIV